MRAEFGAPEAPPRAEDRLAEILIELRQRGSGAALIRASQWGEGWPEAVQLYLKVRAWREEQLAAELARLRAALVRDRRPPTPAVLLLEHRLAEVRAARQRGITPEQAVADKPEVVVHGLPRWVTYAGLTLSALTVLSALAARSEKK